MSLDGKLDNTAPLSYPASLWSQGPRTILHAPREVGWGARQSRGSESTGTLYVGIGPAGRILGRQNDIDRVIVGQDQGVEIHAYVQSPVKQVAAGFVRTAWQDFTIAAMTSSRRRRKG